MSYDVTDRQVLTFALETVGTMPASNARYGRSTRGPNPDGPRSFPRG